MADASSTFPGPTDRISAHAVLNLAGRRVELELTVPAAPVRPSVVLPVLQGLWATVEAGLVEDVERQGKRISCGPGCGACCRQLVPISPIEARHLADLVQELPEPRRTSVRARFNDAIGRLREAGLLEALCRPEGLDPDDRVPLGMDYFRRGIPCPFLEHESCSIHADRPLACREYLVTSPAENCASPTRDTVECVPLPLRLSGALGRFASSAVSGTTTWVPLVLATEWAQDHPDPTPARPGPEWVTLLFRELTGKEIPAPRAEGGSDPARGE
jgi:Fe-S-cluster containining protein